MKESPWRLQKWVNHLLSSTITTEAKYCTTHVSDEGESVPLCLLKGADKHEIFCVLKLACDAKYTSPITMCQQDCQ